MRARAGPRQRGHFGRRLAHHVRPLHARGVNNTDVDLNSYVVQPSIDAIQEMKVQTGVYPAQYGYNATQVNVVSKSGGNQYHGTAFDFVRNNYAGRSGYDYNYPLRSPRCSPINTTTTDSILRADLDFPSLQRQEPLLLHGQRRMVFAGPVPLKAPVTLPTAAIWAAISAGYTTNRWRSRSHLRSRYRQS